MIAPTRPHIAFDTGFRDQDLALVTGDDLGPNPARRPTHRPSTTRQDMNLRRVAYNEITFTCSDL
jgi:hypothetical protein